MTAGSEGFTVAIVSNAARIASFQKMLHIHNLPIANEGGEATKVLQGAAPLDWHGLLAQLNRARYDILVIDETAIPDMRPVIAGIGFFLAKRPSPDMPWLRPVLVGRANADPHDDVYVQLASAGMYDLVLPAPGAAPMDGLYRAIMHPTPREAVADLIREAPTFEANYAASAADPADKSAAGKRATSRVQSVIAVAGIMPRSGCSNCAVVLARTLVMLGQRPALLVDRRQGSGLRKAYQYAMSPDGRSFRINGIDIYPEVLPAQIGRQYTHVIYDAGYLAWGRQQTPAEAEKFREFSKADLQVVYLPCNSPSDFEYLSKFWESRSGLELERYAIGVWGATPELFARLLAKFREKAPGIFMWNVDVYRWPLSLGRVDRAIVEALRPVLPRDVADAAAGTAPAAETCGAAPNGGGLFG